MGNLDEATQRYKTDDDKRLDLLLEHARASFILTAAEEKTSYGRKDTLTLAPSENSRAKVGEEHLGTLVYCRNTEPSNNEFVRRINRKKFTAFRENLIVIWTELRRIITKYEQIPTERDEYTQFQTECTGVPALTIKLTYFTELRDKKNRPILTKEKDRYYTGMDDPHTILDLF